MERLMGIVAFGFILFGLCIINIDAKSHKQQTLTHSELELTAQLSLTNELNRYPSYRSYSTQDRSTILSHLSKELNKQQQQQQQQAPSYHPNNEKQNIDLFETSSQLQLHQKEKGEENENENENTRARAGAGGGGGGSGGSGSGSDGGDDDMGVPPPTPHCRRVLNEMLSLCVFPPQPINGEQERRKCSRITSTWLHDCLDGGQLRDTPP